jgi:hypothetical protein
MGACLDAIPSRVVGRREPGMRETERFSTEQQRECLGQDSILLHLRFRCPVQTRCWPRGLKKVHAVVPRNQLGGVSESIVFRLNNSTSFGVRT